MVAMILVTGGRERVCTDPGKKDATLGAGGPGPPGRGEEQQLIPDIGGGETCSMTRHMGDCLATTSRGSYEQSECCRALYKQVT